MNNNYTTIILDHYKNPHNCGKIPNPTISHTENNPLCGDVMTIDLLVEKEILKDIKFSGHGCAISQAGISILSDQIIGKEISYIKKLGEKDIIELLEAKISKKRLQCAMMGLLTIQNAIKQLSENS